MGTLIVFDLHPPPPNNPYFITLRLITISSFKYKMDSGVSRGAEGAAALPHYEMLKKLFVTTVITRTIIAYVFITIVSQGNELFNSPERINNHVIISIKHFF